MRKEKASKVIKMPHRISKTCFFFFLSCGFTGYIDLKVNWNNKILQIMLRVKIS